MSREAGPENGPETDFDSVRPISLLLTHTHTHDMEEEQKGLLIAFEPSLLNLNFYVCS